MKSEAANDELYQFRWNAEHKAALDEIRRGEPDLPTRAAMLRRLIERAAPKKARK